MKTNAQKIQAWRDDNAGRRLTTAIVKEILAVDRLAYRDLGGADLGGAYLGGAYLRGAYLGGAYLGGAYLGGAYLGGAYLGGAYLRGAYLGGAYLRGADLRGADLGGAYLRGADLRGADLGGAYLRGLLTVTGLPSGDAQLVPTADGWHLKVGCWTGTIDALAELVASDSGWPEARGDEVTRRRPGLEALIVMCRAHVDRYPDLIDEWAAAKAEWDAEQAKEAQS